MPAPDTAVELIAGFERFVRDTIPDLAAQERTWFDDKAGSARDRVVIYGFGSLGKLVLKGLRALSREPVAIADQRLSATQREVEGIPCLSPAEAAARFGNSSVFVVSVSNQTGGKGFREIEGNLRELGAARVSYFLPLLWKEAEAFLPYYGLDRPSKIVGCVEDILRVFDHLADDQSRADLAIFLYHLLSPEPAFTSAPRDQATYFPKNVLQLSKDEAFVGGGAYTGDTLERFLRETDGRFTSYIGVEPDPENFQALEQHVANLRKRLEAKLEVRRAAIGATNGEAKFEAARQLGSAVSASGSITVPLRRIPDLLNGSVPTYIKLDIEGAELDALVGASELISDARPKLAVCAYHQQMHCWKIPALMRELNPDYRLFFRRHCEYLDDVVAYAIPA